MAFVNKQNTSGIALFAFGLLVISASYAKEPLQPETSSKPLCCLIPQHGYLELVVPPSWRADIKQPEDSLPPTIAIDPISGKDFQVLVTIGWKEISAPGYNKPETLRALLTQQRDEAATQAVETELPVKEMVGNSGTGFYFSATDKQPKPGEFRCMTQGMIPIKDLLLAFTIFSNDLAHESIQGSLTMLENAKRLESACPQDDTKTPETISIALVDSWLPLLDSSNYSECWEQMSNAFKSKIDKKTAVIGFGAMRQPLGGVKARKLLDAQYVKSLQGYPDQDGVLVEYSTSFENGKEVTEMIGTIHEKDNTWRIIGYVTK